MKNIELRVTECKGEVLKEIRDGVFSITVHIPMRRETGVENHFLF